MKKALLVFLFATIAIGGYAQKGMQGAGLDVAFGMIDKKPVYGPSLRYHYNITDYVRLSANAVYGISGGPSLFLGAVSSDFFLAPVKRFRPFLSIGAGVYSGDVYRLEHGSFFSDEYESKSNLLLNGGIGFDYRFSYNWSLQCKFTGYYFNSPDDKDFSGFYWKLNAIKYMLNLSLGLTYNF